MAKLESCVQREIIAYLEGCGWYVVKLIQTNKNGIPDLLCLKNGSAMFVEVKREKQRARPLQNYRINELIQYGATAFVACSVEDVKANMT